MNFKTLYAYIQGKRTGKDVNRLERDALNDPFLQDALDGFDAVEGDHLPVIEDLKREIEQKTNSRHNKQPFLYRWHAIAAAASIVLVIGIGSLLVLNRLKPDMPYEVGVAAEETEEENNTIVADQTVSQKKKNVLKEELTTEEQEVAEEEVIAPPLPPILDSRSFKIVSDESNVRDADTEAMDMKTDVFADRSASKWTEGHFNVGEEVLIDPAEDESLISSHDARIVYDSKEVIADYSTAEPSIENLEIMPPPILAVQDTVNNGICAFPDKMPQFPGGEKEMMKYIIKNLVYPADALENNIQGRVVVSFIVEKDGSITGAKVVRSKAPSLDKEALRVINFMPKWTPGEFRNQKVRVKYIIPINFKIPLNK